MIYRPLRENNVSGLKGEERKAKIIPSFLAGEVFIYQTNIETKN